MSGAVTVVSVCILTVGEQAEQKLQLGERLHTGQLRTVRAARAAGVVPAPVLLQDPVAEPVMGHPVIGTHRGPLLPVLCHTDTERN